MLRHLPHDNAHLLSNAQLTPIEPDLTLFPKFFQILSTRPLDCLRRDLTLFPKSERNPKHETLDPPLDSKVYAAHPNLSED